MLFRSPPPSPAVPCRPLPSPSVPYLKLAQTVGLLVLTNDGRPGSSRTRTDDILPSRLVRGSWQSRRRALRGPRTAENTGCMLQGWLQDLAFEQMDNYHCVTPLVVPDVIDPAKFPLLPQAVWLDVAVVLPRALHTRFGDVNILYSQLASMKSWLSSGIPRDPATGLWSKTFQFGDWLDPSAPGEALSKWMHRSDARREHISNPRYRPPLSDIHYPWRSRWLRSIRHLRKHSPPGFQRRIGNPHGPSIFRLADSICPSSTLQHPPHPGTSRSREPAPCRSRPEVKIQDCNWLCRYPVHPVNSHHNG